MSVLDSASCFEAACAIIDSDVHYYIIPVQVQRLNKEGYSVCGIDLQGAGRSAGLRCYCNNFEEYIDNALMLTRRCTEMDIAGFERMLPKFLLGGSVGGCLAVNMALREVSR